MKKGVCILCMVMAWLQTVCAGEWQWVVTLKGFCIGRNEKGTGSLLVGSGTLRATVGRDVEPAEYDGRDVV